MSYAGIERLAPSSLSRNATIDIPITPLDVSADATFDLWLTLPASDTRTIAEFAAYPVGRADINVAEGITFSRRIVLLSNIATDSTGAR